MPAAASGLLGLYGRVTARRPALGIHRPISSSQRPMTGTNPFITQTKKTSEQVDPTRLIHRSTPAAVKFLHLFCSCRAIFEVDEVDGVDGHPTLPSSNTEQAGTLSPCLALSQAPAILQLAKCTLLPPVTVRHAAVELNAVTPTGCQCCDSSFHSSLPTSAHHAPRCQPS